VRSTVGHKGELGADGRQPDPAEHVQVDVGQPQRPPGVAVAGHPTSKQQAEPHPGEQGGTGGQVEPDRCPQSGRQGSADPGGQGGRVGQHDHPGQASPAGGQARAAAVHAAQHPKDPQVQGQGPGRGRPLADGGGVQ
jgi:hypothetical protein